MNSYRKKSAPKPPPAYHPAAAVMRFGDGWIFAGAAMDSISAGTWCAIKGQTQDWREGVHMIDYERGNKDRIEWTLDGELL